MKKLSDHFLKIMHDISASDLHLRTGLPPMARVHGDICPLPDTNFNKPLTNDILQRVLQEVAPKPRLEEFKKTGDTDFGYEIPKVARFRVNAFRSRTNNIQGLGIVFREIPSTVLTAEQLGLPPILPELALLPKGLVLVTGPTGSGKSTTLAAMIDHANEKRKDHILTIEDPIEFVHKSKNCIVTQREVGRDTRSFAAALRGALREDPDIILVGEMRDLETISLAIEAAMTGHLVLATLHTINASKTVDRIIEIFPASEQAQIRSTLADALRAVISQTMFKRIDKKGRVVAFEILIAIPSVRNNIREAQTYQIPNLISTGKKYGMVSLDQSIMELLKEKMIDPLDAYSKAIDKSQFKKYLSKSDQKNMLLEAV